MAKFYQELTKEFIKFINEQKVFFVATAPTASGRVNVSPKGYDTLRIISNTVILYADYHGSGNETAQHIKENKRITVMWNSFDEDPLILRVYGRGNVITKDLDEFERLREQYYSDIESRIVRQLFIIEIDEIQSSCGWGVPMMKFQAHREKLDEMSKKHMK